MDQQGQQAVVREERLEALPEGRPRSTPKDAPGRLERPATLHLPHIHIARKTVCIFVYVCMEYVHVQAMMTEKVGKEGGRQRGPWGTHYLQRMQWGGAYRNTHRKKKRSYSVICVCVCICVAYV